MFETALEVEFGPHWADVLMLVFTLATAGTTATVAILAYKSSKLAVETAVSARKISNESLNIAKEANDREHNRFAVEVQNKEADKRSETALVMIRAILAQQTFSRALFRQYGAGANKKGPFVAGELESSQRAAQVAEAEAMARATLFDDDLDLTRWIWHIIRHIEAMYDSHEFDNDSADDEIEDWFTYLGRWGSGAISTHELVSQDIIAPLEIAEETAWCQGLGQSSQNL